MCQARCNICRKWKDMSEFERMSTMCKDCKRKATIKEWKDE